jgi:hypothetical protein
MPVTMTLYNHTAKLIANKEINLANLRVVLLNSAGAAAFSATHTSKDQVDGGSKQTVTMTLATPSVLTWPGAAPAANTPFILNTTGALGTGATPGATYFVKAPSGSTSNFSATAGGANINLSGSQSGVHSAIVTGANEVYGNGWPANGPTLTNVVASTVTTNDAMIDADDVSVLAAGGSIGPGASVVVYDSLTAKPLLNMDFGQLQSAGDTTEFKVVWHASGMIALQY